MTTREEHWQQAHSAKGPHEVSWYQRTPEMSLSLIRAAGLGPSDPIIDIGCGASALVDHLLSDGFAQLTCLDISEAALALSREALGAERAKQVQWIAADITAWPPPEGAYALWHDRAALHFLTDASDRAAYVRAAARAVRPGGAALIAGFAPDGPTRCSNLDVRQSDGALLAAEFAGAFTLVEERRESHMTPWGKEQQFAWVVLRRRERA